VDNTISIGLDTDVPRDVQTPSDSRPLELAWAGTAASQSIYARRVKPVTDLLAGLFLALALLPVILIIALTIRIKLGGPILIHQERVGLNGRYFKLLKFRTMSHDRRSGHPAPAYQGIDRRETHKSANDPRHTNVGRRLRKFGLDELPQIWNIIRGDMSLIGPRPELPDVVQRKYQPSDHRRTLVKPGLTGLWQVTKRGEGQLMYHDIQTDLEYIETISLKSDIKIAFATVRNLLARRHTGT